MGKMPNERFETEPLREAPKRETANAARPLLSRRSMLAAVGAAGAAVLAGGFLHTAYGDQSVNGAVYGNGDDKKLRDWTNVKTLGIAGDGQTPADRDVIQAAVNAARQGDTFYFPPDVDVLCVQAIDITVPGVTFTGAGKLRLGADNVYTLRIMADDVVVDGLGFHNPSELKRIGEPHGSGTRSGAIEIRAHRAMITRCRIDRMLIGILVNSGTSTTEYRGTRIVNNQITNHLGAAREDLGDGICIFGSDAIVVGNYVASKPGEDPRIGINFESLIHPGWENGHIEDGHGTIQGNVVVGPFRRGIHIETSGVTATGNTVKGQTWWGFMSYGDRNVIANNVVESPPYKTTPAGASWNPPVSGIMVYRGKAAVVEGNTIMGGAAHGIRVHKEASGVILKSNQLVKSASGASFTYGIHIVEAHGTIVEGNHISEGACSDRGISVWKAKNIRIAGNYVAGCGSHGIKLEGDLGRRYDSLVQGNIVKNNVGSGINLVHSSFTTISGNQCTDDRENKTQTSGLLLYNSDDCLIYGNGLDGNAGAAISQSLCERLIAFGNRGYADGTIVT
ncbi:right-handed parallel beta-helix repeat-containing protein [Paenibacillus sp. GYB003]|uniref:right-handed parallel beta-helix repeat-containing protein n=1 Tax=Paenibacillus sp. GYB003 TaxID=2994392 RepID=UPI002F96E4B6